MTPTAAQWMGPDLSHIWLPYTQMKTAPTPPAVIRTDGCYLTLSDGRRVLDGIASWWTACHGYNHPYIAAAVQRQLERMPHVMFGGLVHEPALTLASRLCHLLGPGLDRVFFTESGSVSVEVAIKMVLQYWFNLGQPQRKRIVAFRGGYHGDTFGTMNVSDPAVGMHDAFAHTAQQQLILPLPVDEQSTAALRADLAAYSGQIAAMLVEPLVQGAGGMLMHEPEVLLRLRKLADEQGILLIFDEIFTGLGRTGSLFAFQQAGVRPDVITLSKALTAGTLPLAATVASHRIFEAFWSDDPSDALMHGPTYMGNPLACAAAHASLDLFEQEPRLTQVKALETVLRVGLERCRALPCVHDVRVKGAIGAVQLRRVPDRSALCKAFLEAGAWIRPLGKTVYLTPAFIMGAQEAEKLTDIVHGVLKTLATP